MDAVNLSTRPTMTYFTHGSNWIDLKHKDTLQYKLDVINGPTLAQKQYVLDELAGNITNIRNEIIIWKDDYRN